MSVAKKHCNMHELDYFTAECPGDAFDRQQGVVERMGPERLRRLADYYAQTLESGNANVIYIEDSRRIEGWLRLLATYVEAMGG